MAHGKVDTFPADDKTNFAGRCVMGNHGVFAAGAAAEFAGTTGIGHAPPEQVPDWIERLVRFDVGHARNRIGDFAAEINAVLRPARTTRAGKGLGTSWSDDKLADDLGNVIEGTRISGRRSDFFTAGKLAPGNLRLLQQNLP
jgi:hypothetical protein